MPVQASPLLACNSIFVRNLIAVLILFLRNPFQSTGKYISKLNKYNSWTFSCQSLPHHCPPAVQYLSGILLLITLLEDKKLVRIQTKPRQIHFKFGQIHKSSLKFNIFMSVAPSCCSELELQFNICQESYCRKPGQARRTQKYFLFHISSAVNIGAEKIIYINIYKYQVNFQYSKTYWNMIEISIYLIVNISNECFAALSEIIFNPIWSDILYSIQRLKC